MLWVHRLTVRETNCEVGKIPHVETSETIQLSPVTSELMWLKNKYSFFSDGPKLKLSRGWQVARKCRAVNRALYRTTDLRKAPCV